MVHCRSRSQTEFVVLPPTRQSVNRIFRNAENNVRRHDELLAEMQRFRGRVYLADGAIRASELTADGRHAVGIDERSWHVLSLNSAGRVVACLRYLEENHAAGFDDLWVRHAAMSRSPHGRQLRSAVEDEMARARQMKMGFGEVGGWAVAEEHRRTLEPVRIILATYGLLQLLGGCAGVATATFRHCSAAILRRIGLSPLRADGADLPPYYDPHYDCEMEVLRFDSRFPSEKYREWVNELGASLKDSPVICRENRWTAIHQGVFGGFELPQPELVPAA